MIQFVSLGSWCRTAHQARSYAENREGIRAGSFPYDWTITSFNALCNTLQQEFMPDCVLQPGQVSVSRFNSGTCENSGIIFHHALGPMHLRKIANLNPGDMLPETPESLSLLEKSRDRFLHTYHNLELLKSGSEPLVFIRWKRRGHPDPEFPEAFENETPEALFRVLATYLGRENFYLLVVESQIQNGVRNVITDPIAAFQANERIITAKILERRGWNGDGSSRFQGDEPSWTILFDRALQTWGLMSHLPAEDSATKIW